MVKLTHNSLKPPSHFTFAYVVTKGHTELQKPEPLAGWKSWGIVVTPGSSRQNNVDAAHFLLGHDFQ